MSFEVVKKLLTLCGEFFCCNFIFYLYYNDCSGRPKGLWARNEN